MNRMSAANLLGSGGSANPVRLSLRPDWGARASDPPRTPWGSVQAAVLDPERAAAARDELRGWPAYSPTPLRRLPELARRLGVADVRCKDESSRFGIGSFKALGGAHAVLRVLQEEVGARTGSTPTTRDLMEGQVGAGVTTITASAGNHGRSVAWGSQLFGCDCVVVLPEGTQESRAAAIESHGARVDWFPGPYDEAVEYAERRAAERGWQVVSDTAYEGYETIPRYVYEGYTLLAEESLSQMGSPGPTHVFVQTGVGGLATGVCGHIWSELGDARPAFVAVEPLSADCFGRSIRAGAVRTVAGPFDTDMGGLASGVPSTLAWPVLGGCLDAGVAISEETSRAGMRALASGELGAAIAAGPSGASGVGALIALTRLPTARRLLGLSADSRILVLVTETKF